MKKYKHFFFDMDGTICNSRQVISYDMKWKRLIELWKKKKDVVIISGASFDQMIMQTTITDWGYCLAQSGNYAPYKKYFYNNKLTDKQVTEIYTHALKIQPIKNDMIENRGCQIAFSLVGHNAPLDKKKSFDPNGTKRKELLKKTPFVSKTLTCRIGGTTCLDYTKINGTKGKNIEKFIKKLKWNKRDCIYFGDALFKGGNDESVIGVIDTISVKGPEDLFKKLKKYI